MHAGVMSTEKAKGVGGWSLDELDYIIHGDATHHIHESAPVRLSRSDTSEKLWKFDLPNARQHFEV